MSDRPLRTYVFLVEGEMQLGTIEDYAKHWESCHYSELFIDGRLWILPEQEFVAVIVWDEYDEDGYAVVTICVGDESTNLVVSGNA